MGYIQTRGRINLLVYYSVFKGEEGTGGDTSGLAWREPGMSNSNACHGLLRPGGDVGDFPER